MMLDALLPLCILLSLTLLQIKHLVIDWVWQPPYEHQNKHVFMHWGGIRHALKNAVGTGLCLAAGFLLFLPVKLVIWLAMVDFLIHYATDLGKTNLNRALGLGPTTHAAFWWLTGLDQFVHQATYIGLVAYAVSRVM